MRGARAMLERLRSPSGGRSAGLESHRNVERRAAPARVGDPRAGHRTSRAGRCQVNGKRAVTAAKRCKLHEGYECAAISAIGAQYGAEPEATRNGQRCERNARSRARAKIPSRHEPSRASPAAPSQLEVDKPLREQGRTARVLATACLPGRWRRRMGLAMGWLGSCRIVSGLLGP